MKSEHTHFAHREASGLVVDLFWDPDDLRREFRIEVADRNSGDRFVLFPGSGKEAVQAFHHPFAAGLDEEPVSRAILSRASPRRSVPAESDGA